MLISGTEFDQYVDSLNECPDLISIEKSFILGVSAASVLMFCLLLCSASGCSCILFVVHTAFRT